MTKFLRRTSKHYSKLGKKRKNKQTWRRPTGRDNKMREKRRGYPVVVSIGYRKDKKIRGMIEDKKPLIIMNIKDLNNIKKDQIAVVGNIGKKKKIEIIKKAEEKKIEIKNVNSKKFLNKIEKENKKKESKKTKEEKEDKKKEVKKKESKEIKNTEENK